MGRNVIHTPGLHYFQLVGPVISVFNVVLTLWQGPSSPWGTSDEASPKLSSLFPRSLALYLVPPLLIVSHLTVRYHRGLITQSMMLESTLYSFSQILLFCHHILSSLLSRLFLNPLPALHPNCYCLVRPSSSLIFQSTPTALWQASQPSVLKACWSPSRLCFLPAVLTALQWLTSAYQSKMI